MKGTNILTKIYRQLKYLFGYGPVYSQWQRVVLNRETIKLIKELPYSNLKCLEISGEGWKEFGFKSYRSITYPDIDICQDTLEEQFDIIIAEQVFEHLLYPYRAGKNVYSMLGKNGYFLITTPFLLQQHNHPYDCTRWTSTGMKYFLAECGFELDKIKTFAWGNKECVIANLGHEWKQWNNKFHSLKNQEDFPIVVWALAQKT
jgi:hypothetical protein